MVLKTQGLKEDERRLYQKFMTKGSIQLAVHSDQAGAALSTIGLRKKQNI